MIGLSSLAAYIVTRCYDSLACRPDQRPLALAKIYEQAGKIDLAEDSFRQAAALGPNEPDNFLFLGQFFARHERPLEAIRAFEEAIGVARESPTDNAFARKRIDELRRAS